jgi:hypothetical protein
VRFALDRDSSARLSPAMRAHVRTTLEALCRHDTDALVALFDPARRDAQLRAQSNDRARFVGEQFNLRALQSVHAGLTERPLSDAQSTENYGEMLRRAERAVVLDARPWGDGGGLIVRGVLALEGGPHCSFAFGLTPREDGYVTTVILG